MEVRRLKKKKGKAYKRRKRRRIIFAIEIIVLLVLAVVVYFVYQFSKIKINKLTASDIEINQEILGSEILQGYRNIAIFGVDSREGILVEGAHSDMIIIASINNKTKDVKLVSVYRDTYLNSQDNDYRKATEAYYFGGPKQAINMLNKNLDLNITDYATVDFGAVVKMVDLLGGIDIEITEEERGHLNNYLIGTSEALGTSYTSLENSGYVHLDGLQATSYARIRYTEGGDYKRAERQRAVIGLIAEKAKSANLLTLNSVINEVFPMVSSSLQVSEILSLSKDVFSYNMGETAGFPFDKTTAVISNRGDCVVPINLTNNVVQLHQFLFGNDGYAPTTTVQEISNNIINQTGIQ